MVPVVWDAEAALFTASGMLLPLVSLCGRFVELACSVEELSWDACEATSAPALVTEQYEQQN